jgi:hypothetical protein
VERVEHAELAGGALEAMTPESRIHFLQRK